MNGFATRSQTSQLTAKKRTTARYTLAHSGPAALTKTSKSLSGSESFEWSCSNDSKAQSHFLVNDSIYSNLSPIGWTSVLIEFCHRSVTRPRNKAPQNACSSWSPSHVVPLVLRSSLYIYWEKRRSKTQSLEDPFSFRLGPWYNSSDCASNNNEFYKYAGKSLFTVTAGTRRRRPWRELTD